MTARRLGGMDSLFLYAEASHAPLNCMGVITLESRGRSPHEDFACTRAQIAGRLATSPLLRRRLLEVPLGLDHPVWVQDPHFDFDSHLHRTAASSPGGARELAAVVARIAQTPLPRDRPLWELHFVEGLEHGRFALVAKLHHALVDGIGSVRLLARLLDLDRDGKQLVPVEAVDLAEERDDGGRDPSPLSLFAGAARELSRRPLRGARQLLSMGLAGAGLASAALRGERLLPAAPRSPLNGSVSSRRAVATGSVSLESVKRVKDTFGGTVNHVVLAACAGALRRYLATHDRIPRGPLVAAVPTALDERAADGGGNAVSVWLVPLPVHRARALDRLIEARRASDAARRGQSGLGAQLGSWIDLATPALVAGAAGLYRRLGLADRHAPLHNLVISNVAGPQAPLFCAGARVVECHPLGPIYDGWGLNLTVMSYAGRIGLGAIGCPARVPGIEQIPRAFEACVDQLERLALGDAGGVGSRAAARV